MNNPQGKLFAAIICVIAVVAVVVGWRYMSKVNAGPDTAGLANQIKSNRTDLPILTKEQASEGAAGRGGGGAAPATPRTRRGSGN